MITFQGGMVEFARMKLTSAIAGHAKMAEYASTNKRRIRVHVFSVQYVIIYICINIRTYKPYWRNYIHF